MKAWLQFVSWFNRKAKSLSIRLVKWTGKSREYIHPKHLVGEESHHWFIPFLKSEDTVLDLGCGGGAHSLVAARVAKSVMGLDGSPRNLGIAKRLAQSEGLANTEFKQADLEKKIEEPDGRYSVVLALDILEHLVNRDQFLNEIHRVLRADGALLLAVPNVATRWKRRLKENGLFFYSDLDHKHEYDKDELTSLLTSHRFRIRHWEPSVYDTPWVGLMDVAGGISLSLYQRFATWKRERAIQNPLEATGFRIQAVKC